MLKQFSEDLFLSNETGKYLYNEYAKKHPIIDYHCHLLPKEIHENKVFSDLGEVWLAHDHYKWRTMRTFGIDEKYITGDASYYEKFLAFAKIMPKLIGNPVYIWCALELKRYFDIEESLCEENAKEIFEKTKKIIEEKQMSPHYFIEQSNVEFVATTDDPIDDLHFHSTIKEEGKLNAKVVPSFRPDKCFYLENDAFSQYVNDLSNKYCLAINSFKSLISALENRLIFFKSLGSNINDNGITHLNFVCYSLDEIENIFRKAINGEALSMLEVDKYKSAFLYETGKLYHKHEFVMQLHLGTYKNVNSVMFDNLGADTGYDCVSDDTSIKSVGAFLDILDKENALPKTILYPLNINNYETFSVLAAAFCNGASKAKVQLGAPWWFNDQVYGINKQFESIANLYPISLSVGMLTDSRSFLSYPRHELYRRVLCNYLGSLIERGEYFGDEKYIAEIIEEICYKNAKQMFNL